MERIRIATRKLARRVVSRVFGKQIFNQPELKDGRIFTTEGLFFPSELEITTIRTPIPCGASFVTQYRREGRVVRQDTTIDAQHYEPVPNPDSAPLVQ